VEDVETFAAFLASGVDHLLATEGSGRARGEDTDDAGDGNGNGDGSGDGHGACMVHNPGYDFNDGNVAIGSAYWSLLVERFLPA